MCLKICQKLLRAFILTFKGDKFFFSVKAFIGILKKIKTTTTLQVERWNVDFYRYFKKKSPPFKKTLISKIHASTLTSLLHLSIQ
jgi:hypothetical protein